MALMPHILIFPFMAQGHTLPLLDLAKTLSCRGVRITIFTTPSNSTTVLHTLSRTPNVSLEILCFPSSQESGEEAATTEQLPSMEQFASFFYSVKRLQQPFELSLQKMVEAVDVPPPLCLISDFFLPWTLESASKFNMPRLVFYSFSAYSISIAKSLHAHPHYNSEEPFQAPGLPTKVMVTRSELMPHVTRRDEDDPTVMLTAEAVDAEMSSHGIVLNTFAELEPLYASHVRSYYKSHVWCVGPLALLDDVGWRGGVAPQVWKACSDWLDVHKALPGSVLYVSFGTLACVADDQLTEIACGLEASGCPFVLVVRSSTWRAPDRFQERVAGRGMVLREWAPQLMILAHLAVGGFLTHCGWNAVTESLSAGVPMLTWPMIGEQPLNEKMVVEELGAGLRILSVSGRLPGVLVGRDVVRERVLDLMAGEEGKLARRRAETIGRAARDAVEEGGSSYTSLGELIESVCNQRAPGVALMSG